MSKKTLFVAGRFDDEGGRYSKIANSIYEGVGISGCDYKNGGSFRELEDYLSRIADYELIFWLADVPNDKPKMVSGIKQKNPVSLLVTSKRNMEGKYNFQDLVYHALGIKSNLSVEFTSEGGSYRGRVFDPLGNVFLDYEEDFCLVGKVLGKRTKELLQYTRISSKQAGERVTCPSQEEFFKLVRDYGDTFHSLIHSHPEATNRFFGNASFRCEEGFPSFTIDDLIFVSQRNVDKRAIGSESFVAVKRGLPVRYFGNNKPSVDTPIQIELYNYYPNARFMLHSHAYVKDAPFTKHIIPCGALEEADEVKKVFPDRNQINYSVNLKGHGSLVIVDDVRRLERIPFVAREMPEVHRDYAE